jgi:hypothetical protein
MYNESPRNNTPYAKLNAAQGSRTRDLETLYLLWENDD